MVETPLSGGGQVERITITIDGQLYMVSERVCEMLAQIVERASRIDQFPAGGVEFNWQGDSPPSSRWIEYQRPARRTAKN